MCTLPKYTLLNPPSPICHIISIERVLSVDVGVEGAIIDAKSHLLLDFSSSIFIAAIYALDSG